MGAIRSKVSLSFSAKVLWPALLVMVVFVVSVVGYLELHRTAETWVLWLLGAAAVAAAALLVATVTWHATRPLRLMQNSFEAISRGDFSSRVPVTSTDECGQLAEAFNRLTQHLQAAQQQLEKTVADLQSTRDQLTQSEKLMVIGEFIAGVAHDLNNPLTSVIGYAQLLKEADRDQRHARHTDKIIGEARRCSRIVGQLLAFSRRHQPERQRVNLHDVIHNTIEIVGPQLRVSGIELVVEPAPAPAFLAADAYQLQEVFVNLINNARHAIESCRPDGQVRILTEVHGTRIRLLVADNGPGIAPEHLGRIFEPFFTTKPEGKGTGLGLSLASGIIQEHGGTIDVSSELGRGATFTIELPLLLEGQADLTKTLTMTVPGAGPSLEARRAMAGKRILAIDDDEAIRDLLVEALAAAGCQVETAGDGRAALEKLSREPYDAAVCDICMPGLSGTGLFEQLQQQHHPLQHRWVFITGDITTADRLAADPERWAPCLTKPLLLEQLVRTLGKVLAATPSPVAGT